MTENFTKFQQCDIISTFYLPESDLLKFTQLNLLRALGVSLHPLLYAKC